ncbi:pentapeptide repeat-containing protein [Dorea formicigenerans]|uniref:pentapeptide repeat-containing protein n=1 Tax=Dorea formicigenerans TaxID=39486 RepID=UPI003BEEE266
MNLPWRFPDDSRLSSSRLSDSRLPDSRLSGSRLSDLRCSDSRLSGSRLSGSRCSGPLSMSDLISPSESLPAPLSLTHCYLQLLSYD